MNRIVKALVATATGVGLIFSGTASASSSYSTDPVVVHHSPRPQPKVTNLRVGEHKAFDRVVIDIRGKMPGYKVKYVKKLVYDGTGDPVPLKGKRKLVIVLTPAASHDMMGHPLYEGPWLEQYDMPSLRGVASTGDFEGYVSFGITLKHKVGFKVLELKDPNGPDMLVVDFRHRD